VFAYGSFFLEALGFLPVEVTDLEENWPLSRERGGDKTPAP